MKRIIDVEAKLVHGLITTALPLTAIRQEVMDSGNIVVLKNVFSKATLLDLRRSVIEWGRSTQPLTVDDFRGNYHRHRAQVSRLQQAPHVFHDYNFNALAELSEPMRTELLALFEPLRVLYNSLTAQDVEFSIPDTGPYVHPQLLHYPAGGGFFGRHTHNLLPQQFGFIVTLSEKNNRYKTGGTVFEIDNEIVSLEDHQEIGDICIWRYDHPHWVTQSELREKFDWNSQDGRWVATFAYFDPKA